MRCESLTPWYGKEVDLKADMRAMRNALYRALPQQADSLPSPSSPCHWGAKATGATSCPGKGGTREQKVAKNKRRDCSKSELKQSSLKPRVL